MGLWGEHIPGERTAGTKALWWKVPGVWGTWRKATVATAGGTRGDGGTQWGQVVQGLIGCWQDFSSE